MCVNKSMSKVFYLLGLGLPEGIFKRKFLVSIQLLQGFFYETFAKRYNDFILIRLSRTAENVLCNIEFLFLHCIGHPFDSPNPKKSETCLSLIVQHLCSSALKLWITLGRVYRVFIDEIALRIWIFMRNVARISRPFNRSIFANVCGHQAKMLLIVNQTYCKKSFEWNLVSEKK